ncbi:MAG: hypothetical protein HXY35_10955 [Chloroflexi bacterium]|nr:hypothetical protein [Chloroflexota bacterium]
METIRGKMSLDLDLIGLNDRLANFSRVLLDLGTGDGRYVRHLAERNPRWFVIGVDSCRENLRKHSRAKLPNALFVIANAQELPRELNGLVSHITINFPWGSLLESLLTGDSKLMCGLEAISHENASIELHLNSGALTDAGMVLETGAKKIYDNLLQAGWRMNEPGWMESRLLRSLPTTWAKRLAFGREPQAVALSGTIK